MTEVGGRAARESGRKITERPRQRRAARPEVRSGDEPARVSANDGGLWSIEEVGRYLQVPVSSIYKMTARGAATPIPHIRIGGRLRFRRDDIDRWVSLMATSNLQALERIRQKALKVTHGHDP